MGKRVEHVAFRGELRNIYTSFYRFVDFCVLNDGTHSAPLLEKLHWLPISERIKYKVIFLSLHIILYAKLFW